MSFAPCSGAAPPDPVSGPLAGARRPGMSFAHDGRRHRVGAAAGRAAPPGRPASRGCRTRRHRRGWPSAPGRGRGWGSGSRLYPGAGRLWKSWSTRQLAVEDVAADEAIGVLHVVRPDHLAVHDRVLEVGRQLGVAVDHPVGVRLQLVAVRLLAPRVRHPLREQAHHVMTRRRQRVVEHARDAAVAERACRRRRRRGPARTRPRGSRGECASSIAPVWCGCTYVPGCDVKSGSADSPRLIFTVPLRLRHRRIAVTKSSGSSPASRCRRKRICGWTAVTTRSVSISSPLASATPTTRAVAREDPLDRGAGAHGGAERGRRRGAAPRSPRPSRRAGSPTPRGRSRRRRHRWSGAASRTPCPVPRDRPTCR